MLENKETITLDSTDNVFVGPDEFFKIVIEDFDGETINSWYVEDSEGNRTENLAERSGGQHIDLLLGENVRTVSHFIGRIQGDLDAEMRQRLEELEAMLNEEEEMVDEEADDEVE